MNQKTRSTGRDTTTLNAIAPFLGLGVTFAMAVGFFFFLGWKLDGWLGSTPLFSLVGGLVGAGGGFYYVVRHLSVAFEPGSGAPEGEGGPRSDGE